MNADASITVTVGVRIEPDALFTLRDASKLAHLHPVTLRRKLRQGVVKGSNKAGKWLIRGAELLKLA
jgi:hypothetical protein